ncbi:hypothetical protein SDC9_103855 [bioreactor metagenome]|uniref:Uncharacterized protein n=1 Tax=bioreactor metagenome TaxID=1076179 RepID=A0A645AV85_9ZZZZ
MSPRLLRRPDAQELEDTGLLQHPDDDHHPHQQEDDIPVDAHLMRIEDLVARGDPGDDHRRRRHQNDQHLVDLLGRDHDERGDEDTQRQEGVHHDRTAFSRTGPSKLSAGHAGTETAAIGRAAMPHALRRMAGRPRPAGR